PRVARAGTLRRRHAKWNGTRVQPEPFGLMTTHAQPWSARAWAIHLVRTELRLLIGLTAVSAFLWGFLSARGEVRAGETYKLDSTILLALRRPGQLGVPIGPRWLQETARDITALGGFTVLSLVVVVAVAMLLLHRRRFQAAVLIAAVLVGQVLA